MSKKEREVTAKEWYEKGKDLAKSLEYEKAKRILNESISKTPKDAKPYIGLGSFYWTLKQNNKAREAYKKSITLDPKLAEPWNGLGIVYRNLKEYNKAKEAYKKSIALNPKYAAPWNGLGNVYYDLKEYEKAKDAYKKSIALDPKFAYPWYNLGLLYNKSGDYEHGLKVYKKALQAFKQARKLGIETDYSKFRIERLEKIITSSKIKDITETVEQIKTLLEAKDKLVVHYTSLSTLKLLLENNNKLRFSEATYLNDTSEGKLLFEKVYENKAIKDKSLFVAKLFIGSFVPQGISNSLALWRLYGKQNGQEATGVSITLDAVKMVEEIEPDKQLKSQNTAKESDYRFYKTAYGGQKEEFYFEGISAEDKAKLNKQIEKVRKIISEVKQSTFPEEKKTINEIVNEVRYLFKSKEYDYEREMRLVILGYGFEKKIDETRTPPRVYISFADIVPLIKRITLGPKVERADEWAAFLHHLLKNRFGETKDLPEIEISTLPYK